MIYEICSVFDKKTSSYGNPMPTIHVGDVIREFSNLTQDLNTKFGKNPEDFVLVHTAKYDSATGKFLNLEQQIYLQEGVSSGDQV